MGERELFINTKIKKKISARSNSQSKAGASPSAKVATPAAAVKSPAGIPANPELEAYYHQIKSCTKCRLHENRNKFVFGVGNPRADLMFIGEGPGREEDLRGEPFVGRAGQLLDKILASIGFDRRTVYIANMVKCRPPENRDPQSDEMDTCNPYLLKQIELIQPKIICALGRISAQYLLATTTSLSKLRGKVHDYHGVKLIVTYHPAALLRFPDYKKETWEDMKMLKKMYEELDN